MLRGFQLLAPVAHCASGLGTTWPVHKGSTRAVIRWSVVPRSEAYRRYRLARRFNREGGDGVHRGGRLGSAALRVLEAMVFDFLNYASGRLDPSYEALARLSGLARSTVGEALRRLKAWGIIAWERRCRAEDGPAGFRLMQETNAYAVLPPQRWVGYNAADDEPPSPTPEELGFPPSMPDLLSQAAAAASSGSGHREAVGLLRLSEPGSLGEALAGLERAISAHAAGMSGGGIPASDDRVETGPKIKV